MIKIGSKIKLTEDYVRFFQETKSLNSLPQWLEEVGEVKTFKTYSNKKSSEYLIEFQSTPELIWITENDLYLVSSCSL